MRPQSGSAEDGAKCGAEFGELEGKEPGVRYARGRSPPIIGRELNIELCDTPIGVILPNRLVVPL